MNPRNTMAASSINIAMGLFDDISASFIRIPPRLVQLYIIPWRKTHYHS